MAIPYRPTLVAAEPGRCINKEDTQSEGQSCSLPLRSHPWLGSLCVSLQMNLFLFRAMCARPIKISSSASRVGKGRRKKKEGEEADLLIVSPSSATRCTSQSLPPIFLPPRTRQFIPTFNFHAHAHARTRAHTTRVLPFIHSEIPSIWMWVLLYAWRLLYITMATL